MRQDFTAGIGNFHASSMPIKKVGPEFLFQQTNLPTQCRLCDVKPVGGLAETAKLGHMN
ncbi:hypothetical protein D3C81_1990640 [compost metagenome]